MVVLHIYLRDWLGSKADGQGERTEADGLRDPRVAGLLPKCKHSRPH